MRLEIDGPVAVVTNDNPAKHNAFDDAMDLRLFEILGELRSRPDVRAVFHWQYLNDRPGFELVLPERPKGIPMDTSVQVEVEDRAGRVRRGKDILIRWTGTAGCADCPQE